MVNALFVYGTLGPGKENEEVLSIIGGAFEKAHVRGMLFSDGWLAGFPYPGIDLDEEGEEVAGYLFTSPDLYKHWGRLDAFEGPNYERVLTKVLTDSGTVLQAYVYVINRGMSR